MRKLPLLLAFGLLPFASPAAWAADAQAKTNPSEVVARAGKTDVTAAEVQAMVAALPEAQRQALASNPKALAQAVRLHLAGQMLLKEAKEKKFDQTPEVRAQLEQVRDEALAQLYLASVARVPDGFPSDAELQSAYEANKTAFVTPRQYKLARIFIKGSADDKVAAAKLAEAQKKLKGRGGDFAAVAKAYSDADADKGGEIGWLPEPQIVPEIRSVVAGLAKGAVSEPVRTGDGWHVLKLEDTKPAGVMPLAEIKDALAERLRAQYAQRLRQAYLARLASQNPLVVDELALSKITLSQ